MYITFVYIASEILTFMPIDEKWFSKFCNAIQIHGFLTMHVDKLQITKCYKFQFFKYYFIYTC